MIWKQLYIMQLRLLCFVIIHSIRNFYAKHLKTLNKMILKEEWGKELQEIESNDYGLLAIKLQRQHINQNYGLVNKEDSSVEHLRTVNIPISFFINWA